MAGGATFTCEWETIAAGRGGPGLRSRHGLAHDRRARTTVLFGGILYGPAGGLLADTWEFCDGEWSLIPTGDHPGGRDRVSLVYDLRRHKCVLFGGQAWDGDCFRAQGDAWTYANERWRRCGARPGPPPRCGHALAYDEGAGVTVLFGGAPDPGLRPLGDTWLFDGGSWERVPGLGPPARRHAALAYDPGLDGCVLVGGSDDDDGSRPFGDAWLLRGGAWSRLPAGFDVAPRHGHALAYHRAAGRLLMFGGCGGEHELLVREDDGWRPAEGSRLPPRHQCAPLAWDDALDGLVVHGGESPDGSHQFNTTWLVRLPKSVRRRPVVVPEPPPPAVTAVRAVPRKPRAATRVSCKRCDRPIEVREGFEDDFVRCPKCGSYTTLPGTESAPGYDCAEPFKLCARCGQGLPAKAVLCMRCGYDYRTGRVVNARRTVKPVARHWGGNVPLRLAVAGALLTLGVPLPFVWGNLPAAVAVLVAWGFVLFGLAGTFRTLSLRRDRRGDCTLQTRQWLGFIPLPSRTRALDRRTMSIEPGLEGGGLAGSLDQMLGDTAGLRGAATPFAAVLYLFAFVAFGRCVVTLADDRGSRVERAVIYRCRSASRAREVGDTICELAGLSYS